MLEVTPRKGLLRLLGTSEGTAIAIGVAIGAGIFRTPGKVAEWLPWPSAILAVWAAGGLLVLLDALVLAELAAMRPEAGGHYAFLRDAWGPRASFLYGWSAAFLTWPASVAALAAAGDDFAFRVGMPGRVAGSLIILLPALLHATGLRRGAMVQDLLSYGKAIGLFLFALAALLLAPGASTDTAPAPAFTGGALALASAVGFALQRVLWTYDGYAEAVFVGEEMRDPGRSIPRALLRAVALLTLLYVGVNGAFLLCLGPAGMAGSSLVAADAAATLGGPLAAHAVEVLALLTLLGGASAMLLSGPRISYAMARDGALSSAFTRVTAGGTPIVSLLTMTVLAAAYYLLNTFDQIVETTIFVIWLFVTMTTLALFRFRQREPERERPFRVPLYPALPGLLLVVAVLFLADMVVHAGRSVLLGTGVMAAGLVLERLWRIRHPRSAC